MASVKVDPNKNNILKTIDVKIHCTFNEDELGKDYLLEIDIQVLEGRMGDQHRIHIEEKLTKIKKNEIFLENSYPASEYGFHVEFKWETKLFEMVEMELEKVG